MANAFSLEGETALITGGCSGLDFGIADRFVRAGAQVVLVGRRVEVLEDVAKKLGEAATFKAHDITGLDETDSLIKRVAKRAGSISILVNNVRLRL